MTHMSKKTLLAFAAVVLVVGTGVFAFLPKAVVADKRAAVAEDAKSIKAKGKTKARSSKALAALLKPETNVEAPIHDAALLAISQDERQRREQQLAGLFESVALKVASLGFDLDVDPSTLSEAKLKELEVGVEKASVALEQAVEEIMDDPDAVAFADKVDAQFAAFESANLNDRDAMLPELRGNLEKLVDQIVAKAKMKIGR
jgi:hypothetical protein